MSRDPIERGLEIEQAQLRGFARSISEIEWLLLILVVLMLLGAIPAWPHSRSWGYGPSGGLGLVLLVVVILVAAGRI